MAVYPSSSVLSLSVQDLEKYEVLMDYKIAVVIPAYNEERFIGSVILKVKKYTDLIIVIDDGSDDDTPMIAASAGAIVERLSENGGMGQALMAGFKKAIEFSPDVIVTIDADGQHAPEELPSLVKPILEKRADVVVGSRYIENRAEVPKLRIWGHRFFNIVTRMASGTTVTDSQSGFRAYSREALEAISINSEGFSVASEMQFIATENNFVLEEVPITIYYKDAPKRSVWGQGLQVLGGILKMMGQYRPIIFFGLPGIVTLLVGFVWGLWVVDIYQKTVTLAVGYAIISVMLVIIGMLGLSTGIILHSVRGLLVELLNSKK